MTKEQLINLYETDKDLLNIYHIEAPNTAEVCAERTLADLKDSNVEIHLINKNNEIIGYYGIEKNGWINNLTGFFLKPEFRTKENIIDFWNKVDNNFDRDYYIGVYPKNIRVIEFLNKKTKEKYESNGCIFFKVRR